MRSQEQTEGFRVSSDSEISPGTTPRLLGEVEHNLNDPQKNSSGDSPPKTKHIYLEEEFTYGRFTPYLLLKDKLHTDTDSSGHTALHHMCSHNSQYLPLFLNSIKPNDPILNKANKVGHKPLDVAGIYCRKEYVDLLINKGAIDEGNVDAWAIQGGNFLNWTGSVDIQKKHLIHWAAYNDMPEVLWEFYRNGADMNEKDGNDCTPIDLAVINKCYKSVKALAEMGFKARDENIKNCGSKSIQRIFWYQAEPSESKKNRKVVKMSFVPLFCLVTLLFMIHSASESSLHLRYFISIATFALWIALTFIISVDRQQVYEGRRRTSFFSDICGVQVNHKSNHLTYVLLNIMVLVTGLTTLVTSRTGSYFLAVAYLVVLYITLVFLVNCLLLVYGICRNLTHQQMFDSHKCKYLWKQVRYVQERKILTRQFKNPNDKGVRENIKEYFS